MFPDKNRMIRVWNAVWALLIAGPAVYISIALMLELRFPGRGLARDPGIIPPLFVALAAVSIANLGIMVYLLTSPRFMPDRARYDPVGRVYSIHSLGAILAEAHSIYGLLLTLLSGSVYYVLGFTLVAWICLFWVRSKFKESLGKTPSQ